jgi:hypothetical protein
LFPLALFADGKKEGLRSFTTNKNGFPSKNPLTGIFIWISLNHRQTERLIPMDHWSVALFGAYQENNLEANKREYDYAIRINADAWVVACGGTETPTKTRTGKTLLYVFNPKHRKHAYLDVGTDLILSDEEARAALAV